MGNNEKYEKQLEIYNQMMKKVSENDNAIKNIDKKIYDYKNTMKKQGEKKLECITYMKKIKQNIRISYYALCVLFVSIIAFSIIFFSTHNIYAILLAIANVFNLPHQAVNLKKNNAKEEEILDTQKKINNSNEVTKAQIAKLEKKKEDLKSKNNDLIKKIKPIQSFIKSQQLNRVNTNVNPNQPSCEEKTFK